MAIGIDFNMIRNSARSGMDMIKPRSFKKLREEISIYEVMQQDGFKQMNEKYGPVKTAAYVAAMEQKKARLNG